MSNKFHILYNLSAKVGEFAPSDLKEYGREDALCDAYIFIPICSVPPSLTMEIKTFDGIRHQEIDDNDLYFFWQMMGLKISELPGLTDKQRQLAKFSIDTRCNMRKDKTQ